MKNVIGIIGMITTILFNVLWYYEIVTEPMPSIVASSVVLINHLFFDNAKKILQVNFGKGNNSAKCKKDGNMTQMNTGEGDNLIEIK